MMKKNLIFLLIFAAGVLIGSFMRDWQSGNPSSPQGHGAITADGKLDGGSNPVTDQVAETISHQFLPGTAPYWVYANLKGWREKENGFTALLKEQKISKVVNQFCASLPASVTPALSELTSESDEMRVYLLPAREGNPAPVLTATFLLKEATQVWTSPPGISSLMKSFPDSATDELRVGPVSVFSLKIPFGEIAYLENQGELWISNNKEALAQLWSQPPPPPADPDYVPVYQKRLKDFPGTCLALFANVGGSTEPVPGFWGAVTMRLRSLGIKDASLLFHWEEDGAKMTLLAPGDGTSSWAKQWEPVKKYLFQNDDPVGIIESVIRWPGAAPVASATAVVSATGAEPGDLEWENLLADETHPPDIQNAGQPESGSQLNGEGRQSGHEGRRNRRNHPNRVNEDASSEPGSGVEIRMARSVAQAQFRFLSKIIPPGNLVGFNMFGFYSRQPVLALAVPDVPVDQPLLQSMASMPFVHASTMEVALLPATLYRFENEEFSNVTGLSELLMVERDAITYLFDTPGAADHYLLKKGDIPTDKRSASLRDLLKKVKRPAQIETVFSRDFFHLILDQGKTSVSPDFPYKEDVDALMDELYNHTESMALSAGLDQDQWFLETYVKDRSAFWVDTLLLVYTGAGLMRP